jgi:hypothetical protein
VEGEPSPLIQPVSSYEGQAYCSVMLAAASKVQGGHTQVTRAEYILLLLSFFAILQGGSSIAACCRSVSGTRSLSKTPTLACAVGAAGLEIGILAGLIASTFYFAFTYARVGSRASMLCTVMCHAPRPLGVNVCKLA